MRALDQRCRVVGFLPDDPADIPGIEFAGAFWASRLPCARLRFDLDETLFRHKKREQALKEAEISQSDVSLVKPVPVCLRRDNRARRLPADHAQAA